MIFFVATRGYAGRGVSVTTSAFPNRLQRYNIFLKYAKFSGFFSLNGLTKVEPKFYRGFYVKECLGWHSE